MNLITARLKCLTHVQRTALAKLALVQRRHATRFGTPRPSSLTLSVIADELFPLKLQIANTSTPHGPGRSPAA